MMNFKFPAAACRAPAHRPVVGQLVTCDRPSTVLWLVGCDSLSGATYKLSTHTRARVNGICMSALLSKLSIWQCILLQSAIFYVEAQVLWQFAVSCCQGIAMMEYCVTDILLSEILLSVMVLRRVCCGSAMMVW